MDEEIKKEIMHLRSWIIIVLNIVDCTTIKL